MNTLKKLFSLCLALMLLSLAVPVSANSTNETQYTITINGIGAGHVYKAYQIFAGSSSASAEGGETNASLGVDGWGAHIDGSSFLAALKESNAFDVPVKDSDGNETNEKVNAFASCVSPQDVAEVVAKWTDGSSHLKEFAAIAAGNLNTEAEDIVAVATSANPKVYQFTGLVGGYYLFIDTSITAADNLDDYYSELMLQVSRTTTINPKGDVPEVRKNVSLDPATDPYNKAISAAGNQNFTFRLGADLPTNYNDYSKYYYEFVDTLGPNFDYVNNLKVTLDHSATNVTDPDITSHFEVHYDETNHVLTVKCVDLKEVTTVQSDKIIVSYEATLTGDYDVDKDGNTNTVHLVYSNDPAHYADPTTNALRLGKTPDSIAQVFAYGLTINKIDAATKGALSGAEFVIFRHSVNAEGQEIEEFAKFETSENDGKSRLIGWEATVENATRLTCVNGSVTVYGLTDTTYHLRELEAPDGYNKLDYDPTVVITPTLELNADTNTYEVTEMKYTLNGTQDGTGETATATVAVSIENSAGKTLPSTGGMGTTLIYAAGGIMVLLAVVLLVTKKRMHNN